MMKLSKSGYGKTTHCSLRKIVFGLLCKLHATNRPCAATIAARFVPRVLRKATLSFGAFSRPKVQTS